MRTFLLLLLAVHGLLHLLGFAAAVGYSGGEFTHFISRSWGLGWLAVAGILVSAAGLLAGWHRHWWTVAGVGVLLSQLLIVRFWTDASFGTIPNLLILICLGLRTAPVSSTGRRSASGENFNGPSSPSRGQANEPSPPQCSAGWSTAVPSIAPRCRPFASNNS